jgi:hypothetical protein
VFLPGTEEHQFYLIHFIESIHGTILLVAEIDLRVQDPATSMCRWNLLCIIFRNHEAYEYMKPYKRSLDSRGAYLALRSRYLGPNNVNLMAAELDSQFQGLS